VRLRFTPKRALRWTLLALAALYGFLLLSLAALRFLDPPTTSVQMERRVESWFAKGKYQKRYRFVPLARISPAFQHAVIAAEDGRFFEHHGFDWEQIQDAIEDEQEGKRLRGASTISQQLVKNLFLTTRGSFVRKGLEVTLVPPAELILGKRRILELYLNVIEWGPGVYGAEAAAQTWFHTPASSIGRDAGARLAAVLPSPRRRRPERMNRYSAIILERMALMGW
jgi:monofunctional biosynthetic peptidoglycan transglycosylase